MLIQKVLSVQGAEENSKFLRSMQNVRHIVRTQVMNELRMLLTHLSIRPPIVCRLHPKLHNTTSKKRMSGHSCDPDEQKPKASLGQR